MTHGSIDQQEKGTAFHQVPEELDWATLELDQDPTVLRSDFQPFKEAAEYWEENGGGTQFKACDILLPQSEYDHTHHFAGVGIAKLVDDTGASHFLPIPRSRQTTIQMGKEAARISAVPPSDVTGLLDYGISPETTDHLELRHVCAELISIVVMDKTGEPLNRILPTILHICAAVSHEEIIDCLRDDILPAVQEIVDRINREIMRESYLAKVEQKIRRSGFLELSREEYMSYRKHLDDRAHMTEEKGVSTRMILALFGGPDTGKSLTSHAIYRAMLQCYQAGVRSSFDVRNYLQGLRPVRASVDPYGPSPGDMLSGLAPATVRQLNEKKGRLDERDIPKPLALRLIQQIALNPLLKPDIAARGPFNNLSIKDLVRRPQEFIHRGTVILDSSPPFTKDIYYGPGMDRTMLFSSLATLLVSDGILISQTLPHGTWETTKRWSGTTRRRFLGITAQDLSEYADMLAFHPEDALLNSEVHTLIARTARFLETSVYPARQISLQWQMQELLDHMGSHRSILQQYIPPEILEPILISCERGATYHMPTIVSSATELNFVALEEQIDRLKPVEKIVDSIVVKLARQYAQEGKVPETNSLLRVSCLEDLLLIPENEEGNVTLRMILEETLAEIADKYTMTISGILSRKLERSLRQLLQLPKFRDSSHPEFDETGLETLRSINSFPTLARAMGSSSVSPSVKASLDERIGSSLRLFERISLLNQSSVDELQFARDLILAMGPLRPGRRVVITDLDGKTTIREAGPYSVSQDVVDAHRDTSAYLQDAETVVVVGAEGESYLMRLPPDAVHSTDREALRQAETADQFTSLAPVLQILLRNSTPPTKDQPVF